MEHNELSECAVVELKDALKGGVPFAFVIRNKNSTTSEPKLVKSVVEHVRHTIGPVAAFKQAVVIDKLPKTRSGKIARKKHKAMINNKPDKVINII